VPECALAFSLVEDPLTFVMGTIRPVLDSIAMPDNGWTFIIAIFFSFVMHLFIAIRIFINAIAFSREPILQGAAFHTIST
jgi:hypothetical protein